ncbi:MAG: NADH-quinone oxidoreductase subunit NuoF [Bifidobacteriaceae bacterium]|nr:NADH-quinone oxidoreductase subunit NuoF [Bifidobacteriaceae bacterium]
MKTALRLSTVGELTRVKDRYRSRLSKYRYQALVCGGTGCVSANSAAIAAALKDAVAKHGIGDQVAVIQRGCMGTCAVGPVVYVLPDGAYYSELTPEKIEQIVVSHFLKGQPVEEYAFYDSVQGRHALDIDSVAFFRDQMRVALRNCGVIDVENVDAYIARDGYTAIAKALRRAPAEVVEEITKSGLRGRGGAGFPTGVKWEACRKVAGDQKYIVCNADEGDPGAFMDRSIMEGDPHRMLEGMIIAALACGASRGYIYVRAEYPMAVSRLKTAIIQAGEWGILGENILGSGFAFNLRINRGAGAFVCGEGSALTASIEGKRGMPRVKPPRTVEHGLFNMPTVLNNVETFANVPEIILRGADWYKSMGPEKSPGTKAFALTGNIVNTGLIEVPMGTALQEVIFDIGGGIRDGAAFKAVQIGGPSGGCLTREHLNLPLDFDSLKKAGAMIGSGGLVVMDDKTCMVEVARFFMNFTQNESCGKCVPCREGTKRMLEILQNIVEGKGRDGDIDLLLELADTISSTALCGLGKTAASPVVSTISGFLDEYKAHIYDKKCPAGSCPHLKIFHIDPELCKGCSKCARRCPAEAISGKIKETFTIDAARCIKCGACVEACSFQAIKEK